MEVWPGDQHENQSESRQSTIQKINASKHEHPQIPLNQQNPQPPHQRPKLHLTKTAILLPSLHSPLHPHLLPHNAPKMEWLVRPCWFCLLHQHVHRPHHHKQQGGATDRRKNQTLLITDENHKVVLLRLKSNQGVHLATTLLQHGPYHQR